MNMSAEKTLKKDLISVIMSNYNTPINYLKESIDSVLNQTYSNFEFIIIDDGSTDDSLEFIKSYDDPRIKLVVNKKNIGLTKSLNKGLEAAQGEFIARMDSDDICYPERFEKQIEYMKGHPDTIVCGTWADVIDENGVPREEEWACGIIDDMELYRIKLLFLNRPLILHPSALFNHRMLLKHNIKYDESLRYAQDYKMWTDCAYYNNCHILQQNLLKFRSHKNSISISKRSMQLKCVYIIIQKQLDNLQLTLPDDLKDYHHELLTNNTLFDKRVKQWIKQLLKSNKKYHIYNQKKLAHLLWYRWSRICYDKMSNSKATAILYLFFSLSLRCKIYLIQIRVKNKKK